LRYWWRWWCNGGGYEIRGGYMERTSKNVEIVVVVLLLAWASFFGCLFVMAS
jgi:hypothetical protein